MLFAWGTAVAAVAVLLAYLGGSISFPYWVARLRGVDLRAVGSRKLGGSNLWKSVGPAEAVVGGLLDAAKGFAAVTVARALGLPLEVQLLCGVAAVVGQMWPVFHGFDGGRANSAGHSTSMQPDSAKPAATITAIRTGYRHVGLHGDPIL